MIKIISVGKVRKKELKVLIDDYIKQIPRKVLEIEVKDEAEMEKIHLEATKILSHIKEDDYVITLEILGMNLTSENFSGFINEIESKGAYKNITFIIGGSFGLHETVMKRSNYQLSFSSFTYPHQMMKLILVEQIFRAYTILNNHPYHK